MASRESGQSNGERQSWGIEDQSKSREESGRAWEHNEAEEEGDAVEEGSSSAKM